MSAANCGVCGGELTERGPSSTLVCEGCGRVPRNDQSEDATGTVDKRLESGTGREQPAASEWEETVEIADSTDEQLVELLSYMDEVGRTLGADPTDQDRAAEVITQAWEGRLVEGSSMSVAVGACWYVVFREQREPRPIGCVAEVVNATSSEIHAFRRKVTDELELSLTISQPSEYLPYLRFKLDLPTAVSKKAEKRLENARIPGNPAGVAASGLYLASQDSGEALTMREAGQAVGLSKETIWQRVSDLRDQ